MRQTYRIFCLLACVAIVLASCRGSNRNGTAASDQHIPDRFPMIEVPAMLSTPEERAQYVAAHYWDKFDFTDTAAYLDKPAVTEQGMADFLNILRQYVAPSDAAASLDRLLAGASADTAMFRYLTGLLEKYLYDPNSPMRSEELYIPVLRYLVASPQLDSLAKLRPRARLEMALKNRPGDTAADFAYVDLKGRSGRMHGLYGSLLQQSGLSRLPGYRRADGRLTGDNAAGSRRTAHGIGRVSGRGLEGVAGTRRGLPGELGLCARQGRGAVGGELVRPEGYPDALPAGP